MRNIHRFGHSIHSRRDRDCVSDVQGIGFCGNSNQIITEQVYYKMKNMGEHEHIELRPETRIPGYYSFNTDSNVTNNNSIAEVPFDVISDSSNKLSFYKDKPRPPGASFEESSSDVKTMAALLNKRRKKKRTQPAPPPEIIDNDKLKKYWYMRFSLFSKFDQGIKLDEDSWFSVTPELVARRTAERCRCDTIIDGFCGAGGNTIQFALTCNKVIAIDIDPKKIELARNNAKVYGVLHKIDFRTGDFLELAKNLKGDVVFLSPPWGGPKYVKTSVYNLEEMLRPRPFSILLEIARTISSKVAAFLPRNSDTMTLLSEAGPGGKVEIKQDYLDGKVIGLTAYYNDAVEGE